MRIHLGKGENVDFCSIGLYSESTEPLIPFISHRSLALVSPCLCHWFVPRSVTCNTVRTARVECSCRGLFVLVYAVTAILVSLLSTLPNPLTFSPSILSPTLLLP